MNEAVAGQWKAVAVFKRIPVTSFWHFLKPCQSFFLESLLRKEHQVTPFKPPRVEPSKKLPLFWSTLCPKFESPRHSLPVWATILASQGLGRACTKLCKEAPDRYLKTHGMWQPAVAGVPIGNRLGSRLPQLPDCIHPRLYLGKFESLGEA